MVHQPFRVPLRRAGTVAALAVFGADLASLGAALFAHRPPSAVQIAYTVLALVALAASGAYRLRLSLSVLEDAPRLVGTLAIPALAIAPFGAGRTVLVQAAIAVAALVVARGIAYGWIRRARRRGLVERTLIVGTGRVGIELADVVSAHPEYGLGLVGFVGTPARRLPAPLLGELDRLDELVVAHGIRRVLVAFGPTREAEMVSLVRTAVLRDIEVHVVPRFFEIGVAPHGPDVDDLWGIPVYRVRQAALRSKAWVVKRAFDLVASGLLLVALAPILALVAALVRLTSPGPALFRQHRIGQDGRDISVLKFRTMRVNDESDIQWSAEQDDVRVTPLGRFLRRSSIDELPQLVNVWRGEMSLVGPRPERPFFVHRFSNGISGYGDRHRIPAGLTGWAQVHGLKGDTSIRERARFDNQYIEHWSLWRDVVILCRTVLAAVRAPVASSAPEPVVYDEPVDPAAFGYNQSESTESGSADSTA